jgi:hypothetical protein
MLLLLKVLIQGIAFLHRHFVAHLVYLLRLIRYF